MRLSQNWRFFRLFSCSCLAKDLPQILTSFSQMTKSVKQHLNFPGKQKAMQQLKCSLDHPRECTCLVIPRERKREGKIRQIYCAGGGGLVDRGNPVLGQKRNEGGFSPFKIMGGEGKCCSLPFGLWCILAYSTKVPKKSQNIWPFMCVALRRWFF